MPTIKKRINISLTPSLNIILSRVAKRDNIPQATKALHLLQIALEIEEDITFDRIASLRDTKKARFFAHQKAWA